MTDIEVQVSPYKFQLDGTESKFDFAVDLPMDDHGKFGEFLIALKNRMKSRTQGTQELMFGHSDADLANRINTFKPEDKQYFDSFIPAIIHLAGNLITPVNESESLDDFEDCTITVAESVKSLFLLRKMAASVLENPNAKIDISSGVDLMNSMVKGENNFRSNISRKKQINLSTSGEIAGSISALNTIHMVETVLNSVKNGSDKVHVKLEENNGMLIAEVTDNGRGIHLGKKAFEKGVSGRDSTGLGLGLMAHDIFNSGGGIGVVTFNNGKASGFRHAFHLEQSGQLVDGSFSGFSIGDEPMQSGTKITLHFPV